MEAYAIASLTCAACLTGFLVLLRLYGRSVRQARSLAAELAAERESQAGLIAENIEQSERLSRMNALEVEIYSLRRENARAASSLRHMCQVEAGLRAELAQHARLPVDVMAANQVESMRHAA